MSTPVRIVLVGEAYGAQEAQAKAPFVGPTGSLLNRLCQEAGLITAQEHKGIETALWARDYPRRDQLYARAGIRLTNVFNLQPPSNKIEALCGPKHDKRRPIRAGKYLRPEYYGELDRLKAELEEWQPNIVVGLGATAGFRLETDARYLWTYEHDIRGSNGWTVAWTSCGAARMAGAQPWITRT